MKVRSILGVLWFGFVLSPCDGWSADSAAAVALRLPASVRQSGMAGLGVIGGDALAAWAHPALLAAQERDYMFSGGGGPLLGGETRLVSLGGGVRINERWSAGVLLLSSGGSFAEIDDFGDSAGNTISQSTMAGGLLFAGKVAPWLSAGGAAKFISDQTLDDRASQVGLDLGLRATYSALAAHVSVRNIGPALRKEEGSLLAEMLPLEIRLGAGWRILPVVQAGAERIVRRGQDGLTVLGGEWQLIPMLSLRAGTALAGPQERRFAAGLTATYRMLALDYAFQTHPIGASHQMGITVAFDRMGSRDTPVAAPIAPEKVRRPPRLEVTAVLETGRPQNSLEADGTGEMTITAKNVGGGQAINVTLGIKHEPGGAWLSYQDDWKMGNIDPNEQQAVHIPLVVGRGSPEGNVKFSLVVREGNGFDADPTEFIAMSREFRPPDLRVASVNVFDGQSRSAFGNGNWELEPGESADITVVIENAGRGPARGVVAKVASKDPNVIVLGVNERDEAAATIGDIAEGLNATIKVSVAVTKRFAGGADLPVEIDLGDQRPGLGRTLPIPIKIVKGELRTNVIVAGLGSGTIVVPSNRQSELNIAVSDLEAQETSGSEAAVASDWLRGGLVNLGYLRVVERSRMNRILAEQTLQQTGCTKQDCAVKIGRILNVQRMIVGKFAKFGGKYLMIVQVVNVETGQIILSDQASGRDDREIVDAVNELADRIGRNLR